MKRYLLLMGLATAGTFSQAQSLINYGKYTVSADEFSRAYNKNKTAVTDKEKALREYVELYTNFKLKVRSALDNRYDTLPHIVADVKNFRAQVQDNYITDEAAVNQLYAEAYERGKRDLHVLHFSTPILKGASPSDTLKALQAIEKIHTALKNGLTDYKNFSDQIAEAIVKYNDLGFITVFSIPYQYENIVYALKKGQISEPYRSTSAWHVFKLVEDRPAAGKWKVAQILIARAPNEDAEAKERTRLLADSVYRLLIKGADFAALAQQFSDDKLTFATGGELAEFGSGKYDQSFESKVFALKNDNEISQPFETDYGIHIVKRLAFTPYPADAKDAALDFDFKDRIKKDTRIDASRNRFAQKVLQQVGVKLLPGIKEMDLIHAAEEIFGDPDHLDANPLSVKPLLQIKKKIIPAKDFFEYAAMYRGNSDLYKGETTLELLEKFKAYAAVEYYKEHLEEYNDDYRYQIKEFQEGNMLFEVMEKSVWGKASSDLFGLKAYYEANKQKYKWAPSADVIIFTNSSPAVADNAFKAIKEGKSWRQIVESDPEHIQADSNRYELSQVAASESANTPAPGTVSPLIRNTDGTAVFVKYVNVYPGGEQRTFDEAKGLVISDYQTVLEEKWVAELRKKYPVKVNEDVLKKLLK